MDQNSSTPPHHAQQLNKIGHLSAQERLFSQNVEATIRESFRNLVYHEEIRLQQQFSSSQYLPFQDYAHELLFLDQSIKMYFSTKDNSSGVGRKKPDLGVLIEDKIDIVKKYQDQLIVEMKQGHPFLTQKQLEKSQKNVEQFWKSNSVKPASFGKLFKRCVQNLLVYQIYMNHYRSSQQKTGKIRQIENKNTEILKFITETFDNQNQMLDKIVPLEKQYFICRHVNLRAFPGHQFTISSQARNLRSRKRQKQGETSIAKGTLESMFQQISFAQKRQKFL